MFILRYQSEKCRWRHEKKYENETLFCPYSILRYSLYCTKVCRELWSEQDFKRYMDMFSLDPKKKINTLSKGMKMKYSLALALSHNAELLIMDEPTSGLDPLIRSQLLKVLTEYMENGGKGVFFSTHITSDLDKIADMLIMINNGRIIFVTIHSRFDGSTNKAELQHRFQCSDVFLGRLDREDFGNRIRIPLA